MQLDNTDKLLINLLQKDCKKTVKQLSEILNLSPTAIYERIKKLERNNVITKYVALINKDKIGKSFLVFCQITLDQHSQDFLKNFEKDISSLKEVSECFHVSGNFDYMLKIYLTDIQAYRDFITNKLTKIEGIGTVKSSFTISEVKNSTKIFV